jgi:hypothetical protein
VFAANRPGREPDFNQFTGGSQVVHVPVRPRGDLAVVLIRAVNPLAPKALPMYT